jgi:hypothetical protein
MGVPVLAGVAAGVAAGVTVAVSWEAGAVDPFPGVPRHSQLLMQPASVVIFSSSVFLLPDHSTS